MIRTVQITDSIYVQGSFVRRQANRAVVRVGKNMYIGKLVPQNWKPTGEKLTE